MHKKPAYRSYGKRGDSRGSFQPGKILLSGKAGAARTQIEEKLSILNSIEQYSEDAIITKTTDEIITSWNPGAEKLYGYTAGEALGKNVSIIEPPDRPGEMAAITERIMRDKQTIQLETERKRKDGRVIDVLLIVAPITDTTGQVKGMLAVAKDITASKDAVEALRNSEEKYRNLVENINDWVWEVDEDCRYTYSSPRIAELLGYAPEEIIGREPFDFMPPEVARKVRIAFDRISRNRERFNLLENELIRKDGSLVIVETSGVPIFSERGAFTGYRGIDRDITRRKQAEDEARKMLRVVEESPSTIVITDRNGSIEYANPTFTRLTGYTFEEVKGKNPRIMKSGIMPPEEYKRLWETIKAGKEWRGEFLNKKKNGELYWEYAVIAPLLDDAGNITRFIAIKEDISERKRTEEALRRSRQELSLVLDNMPGFVYFKDTYGKVVMLNQQMADAIGFPVEQIVGKTNEELFPAKYAGKFTRDDRWVLRTGEQLYTEDELPIAGSVTLFGTRKIPLKDAEGKVTGLIGLSFDITELKMTEGQLAASKALADLYLDLMGHDIKNMNMIAASFLEMALDTLRSTGMLPRDEAPMLEKPLESLQNSTSLISAVQKLQRSLAGEKKLEKTDLALAITGAIDSFSHIPGREVDIGFSAGSECRVMADDLLKDIFVNLIGNAIKHSSPDRPLTMKISVSQTVSEEKRWCSSIVEDDGPGISDDVKERLFGRFTRGQTRAPGAGLGLYIVKALVDHYGGRIAVEDRVPGDRTGGTRFIVELPAA